MVEFNLSQRKKAVFLLEKLNGYIKSTDVLQQMKLADECVTAAKVFVKSFER